ncbi:signal peptidase II [Allosphingosinicella deserti]|uniref:Lipoprotein signal peptidase n=1 Tax=Allosphingosinicella deserti TaxID=2116704 RepID=A0A2P7QZ08_9SPHN|nr:signal peptidase II [Sphingomonas deserti]PSJ43183.1 signal peptidase II [Sphingomonas deserti]
MAELNATDLERVRRNRKLGLTIAATVLVLDQASKWIVTYVLQLQQQVVINLAPIFDLRWVENRGVSMGFLTAGSPLERWLLVAMTGAISIFVATWMWRERRRDDAIALAFVLGGALGNIIDRIRLGYVIDFADLHFGDIHPFLVFNVGDAAITIGVLLLLVRALLTRDRTPAPEDK